MSHHTQPTRDPLRDPLYGALRDIGPELVVALARQIPTLETDALVRIITTSEQVTR